MEGRRKVNDSLSGCLGFERLSREKVDIEK